MANKEKKTGQNKKIKLKLLFGKHKFWENTRKKLNLAKSPLASIIKKWNMAIINLTDLYAYCQKSNQRFDTTFAKSIAHEILHIHIMDEGFNNPQIEEKIIGKMIKVKNIDW